MMQHVHRAMRIYLKTQDEIGRLRRANLLVQEVLDAVETACRPGATTWELNEIAATRCQQGGGQPAFLGYHGYPAVICTSLNEVIVHGIPRKDVVLREGDIIGLDFGAFLDGYCGDAARTVAVGKISGEARALMQATHEALWQAIDACRPGQRIGDLGWAIQSHVEARGYQAVRTFVGHGIGRSMHEDPAVPNVGQPGRGKRLTPGMVLAIEPMVNQGTHEVTILEDQWTAVTADRKLSAHFEHSVAVTEGEPYVLSLRE